MDNTADAAHVADLERKVATYEGVLFTIASMPTNYGEQHTREMLILAVNGAKKVLGLGTQPPTPNADAQSKIAVLQAEVRAWRLWYDYPGDSTGMMMELWTNVDKARANTDAQGALT